MKTDPVAFLALTLPQSLTPWLGAVYCIPIRVKLLGKPSWRGDGASNLDRLPNQRSSNRVVILLGNWSRELVTTQ